MLSGISEHLRRRHVSPEASGVSILLIDNRSTVPAAATGERVAALDRLQFARSGPSLAAARSLIHVVVADFAADSRWRDCAPPAYAAGVRSINAVLLMAEGAGVGIPNSCGSMPGAFGPVAVDEPRAFADYAATATVPQKIQRNIKESARQTEEALTSCAIVEQAKDVVTLQRQCDSETGFSSLINLSRTTNRKLHDVAGQLVEQLSGQSEELQTRSRDRSQQTAGSSTPSGFDLVASSPAPAEALRKGPTS